MLVCSSYIAEAFKRVSRDKREESRLTLDWLVSHSIVFSMVSSLPTMHYFYAGTRFRTGIDSTNHSSSLHLHSRTLMSALQPL